MPKAKEKLVTAKPEKVLKTWKRELKTRKKTVIVDVSAYKKSDAAFYSYIKTAYRYFNLAEMLELKGNNAAKAEEIKKWYEYVLKVVKEESKNVDSNFNPVDFDSMRNQNAEIVEISGIFINQKKRIEDIEKHMRTSKKGNSNQDLKNIFTLIEASEKTLINQSKLAASLSNTITSFNTQYETFKRALANAGEVDKTAVYSTKSREGAKYGLVQSIGNVGAAERFQNQFNKSKNIKGVVSKGIADSKKIINRTKKGLLRSGLSTSSTAIEPILKNVYKHIGFVLKTILPQYVIGKESSPVDKISTSLGKIQKWTQQINTALAGQSDSTRTESLMTLTTQVISMAEISINRYDFDKLEDVDLDSNSQNATSEAEKAILTETQKLNIALTDDEKEYLVNLYLLCANVREKAGTLQVIEQAKKAIKASHDVLKEFIQILEEKPSKWEGRIKTALNVSGFAFGGLACIAFMIEIPPGIGLALVAIFSVLLIVTQISNEFLSINSSLSKTAKKELNA